MLRVSNRTTVWVAALCVGVAAVALVAWWPFLTYLSSGCASSGEGGCYGVGMAVPFVSAWLAVLVGLFIAAWVLIVSPRRDELSNLASAGKFCVAPTVVAELALGAALLPYALGGNRDQWSGLLVIAMLVAALPIGIGSRRPRAYVMVCAALAASSLAWSAYLFVPTPLLLVYAGCLLVSAASAAQAAYPGGRAVGS